MLSSKISAPSYIFSEGVDKIRLDAEIRTASFLNEARQRDARLYAVIEMEELDRQRRLAAIELRWEDIRLTHSAGSCGN